MVVVGGHSPKRRRTDNGPVSADAIAQANSTAQFFTAQRQNRWMSGYTPPSNEPPLQQTPQTSRPAVNTGQEQSRQLPNGEGATSAPSVSIQPAHSRASNIVQYESPNTASTTPIIVASSVNNPSRKSLEPVGKNNAMPGLPSPVSSDGNRRSPAVPQQETPSTRGLGRPRIQTNAEGMASVVPSSASPVARTHQRAPSQQHRQQHPVSAGQPTNAYQAAYNAVRAQQQSSPVVGSQPHRPQPHGGYFDQRLMLSRIDLFEKKELPKIPFNHVDRGRLQLLREAIEKGDMFYIVLSQVHCLTTTPRSLPSAVAKLNARAFYYLDMLLCPNGAVSDAVLSWLTDFPTRIMGIYSSPSAAMYDLHVQAVANFLARLPSQWDELVEESKRRQAPPLMEDFCARLPLPSPVLQTTAFRAIARMIFDVGSEKVEYLHRIDQQAFMSGSRRSKQERAAAYFAYRQTMQALILHERNVQQHLSRQQHIPESQRVAPPSFYISQEAIAAFRSSSHRPIPPQALQSNSSNVAAALHQQQNMVANAQMLAHNGVMPNRTGSPAQTITSEQTGPISTSRGNSIILMPLQKFVAGPHLVFPHESEQPRAQPTQPDTLRSALHQAHLRSPLLGPIQLAQGAPRLYRYVVDYAMSLRKIDKDKPMETVVFNVSQPLFDMLPVTLPSQVPGEPPTRILTEASRTLRLRCAALTPKGFLTESAWMEGENCWPDALYLECNGIMLESRRKLQHNRYLPIDLTTCVNQGQNRLTIIVNRVSTDTRPFEYVLAVETVGVMSHEKIVKDLRHISASDSLASIQQSLSGTDDNDDIAITSSNLTIKLFDPFSNAKIFDKPVRGSACLHKDCFDLETFLDMRKRERPGWPTVVDCWRCPICRGDVRPHTLVVDGFMVEVRKQLAEQGLLDTRAIVVEPDGSWKPKKEEQTGVRSPSLEREERSISAAVKPTPVALPKKMPEIIEID